MRPSQQQQQQRHQQFSAGGNHVVTRRSDTRAQENEHEVAAAIPVAAAPIPVPTPASPAIPSTLCLLHPDLLGIIFAFLPLATLAVLTCVSRALSKEWGAIVLAMKARNLPIQMTNMRCSCASPLRKHVGDLRLLLEGAETMEHIATRLPHVQRMRVTPAESAACRYPPQLRSLHLYFDRPETEQFLGPVAQLSDLTQLTLEGDSHWMDLTPLASTSAAAERFVLWRSVR